MPARFIFDVPVVGNLGTFVVLTMLFIVANLSVGYTFSTIAKNQLQAMQMSFFFFLPSILLSGFMFPFRGMPDWAQDVGSILPLTHYLRIVRGVMLKGAGFADLAADTGALAAFTLAAMTVAVAAVPADAGLTRTPPSPVNNCRAAQCFREGDEFISETVACHWLNNAGVLRATSSALPSAETWSAAVQLTVSVV